MEVKDYEVLEFRKGDFQDNFGNYWCDMNLKGVSEPVRIVVKDPMEYQGGMSLYGKITDETSKAGKAYLRFRREKKEEEGNVSQSNITQSSSTNAPVKAVWQPRDDDRIVAQWAIGQAVSVYNASNTDQIGPHMEPIEAYAKQFYAMVDRVKGAESLKAEAPVQGPTVASINKKIEEDIDPEFASLLEQGFRSEGISEEELNAIPF